MMIVKMVLVAQQSKSLTEEDTVIELKTRLLQFVHHMSNDHKNCEHEEYTRAPIGRT